ncbi:MAG: polymer-forming cytoskeletal protein [Candidatus Aminicenantes bacterium]|nr:polymer-forming cytoskeletal protein [Candidatus Aminicenantes bacterium]
MKDKKSEFIENKITGFFDKDTTFIGDLNFKGSFRIDGSFKGKINSESTLIIGDNGKVEADIKIGYISISGEIKGNIKATQKVEISSNGRVIGTVITPKLVVDEGAYLEATCQTSENPAQVVPLKKVSTGSLS